MARIECLSCAEYNRPVNALRFGLWLRGSDHRDRPDTATHWLRTEAGSYRYSVKSKSKVMGTKCYALVKV